MNVAAGTIARYIQVSASQSLFQPGSRMDWERLDGNPDVRDKERAPAGKFKGVATSDGRLFGITFIVAWTDANDIRQHAPIEWQSPHF